MTNKIESPELFDMRKTFHESLFESALSEADNEGLGLVEIELAFGYEINLEILANTESDNEEFPYSLEIDLYNNNCQIIATKTNTFVDACNLSDQLIELTSEFIEKGFINSDNKEVESSEFIVVLTNAPSDINQTNSPEIILSSKNHKVLGHDLFACYSDEDCNLVVEFKIKIAGKAVSSEIKDLKLSHNGAIIKQGHFIVEPARLSF